MWLTPHLRDPQPEGERESTMDLSATVFEILTFKARKWLVFPTHSLFDAPTQGSSLEFLDESYPAKTRGMGLPYGEKFIILVLPFLTDPPV